MEALGWRELGAVKRERAAQILGEISTQSVDDLIKAGKLRSSRAGRTVLISVQSLRAYLGETAPLPVLSVVPQAPAEEQPAPARPVLSARNRRVLAEARRRLG